jgi:hypothetical protein
MVKTKSKTMNKHEAKKLAETVTLDELKSMFKNAQNYINDWTQVSRVNKGMTIGTTYNILSFEPDRYADVKEISGPGLTNMIWEFGEFLPGYEKPVSKTRSTKATIMHQEPIFKL